MTLTSSSKLGAYETISLRGPGGQDEVYKARDIRLDRVVALKVLPSHLAGNPQLKERFEREARTAFAMIAALEKQIGDNEMAIASLNKVVSQRDTELAMLVQKTGVPLSDILAQPMIEGSVIEALYDIEPGLVAINKGSADGVKRGFTFDIYNGSQYKGRVRVENVREATCTALVTIGVPDQAMGQGDSAATSL